MASAIDPVTREVLRHRFMMIADEMGTALAQISSSPVVTEVKDFCTALFTTSGRIGAMGAYLIGHVGAMSFVIEALTRLHPLAELAPGDMFVLNDPYLGALHQSDIVVVSPIFVGGEVIAWAGCMAHHLDVGSVDPGGMSASATEVYQEGLRLPGLRLVSGGRVHGDIMATLKAAVRTPEQLEFDLRGQIAACNTGVTRMQSLCRQYGQDTVVTAMQQFIQATEERLRARVARLPDGTVRYEDFFDNIGSRGDLARLVLTLTKQGDRLTLDFAGTDPQVPGFVNCTLPGTVGGVLTAVLPMLAYDILPWNEGIVNAIDLLAPEGTMVNPRPPAPVSSASTRGMWLVANAVSYGLSNLMMRDPATREGSMAVWYGSNQQAALTGHYRDGKPFATRLMDTIAGGGGGRCGLDGVDCGGNRNSPTLSMMNVEVLETAAPVLFLFRRPARDSGGPGLQRGGCGLEEAFAVWNAPAVGITVNCLGLEFSNSMGLAGGLPGTPGQVLLAEPGEIARRLAERQVPHDMAAFGAAVRVPKPNLANYPLADGDVLYLRHLGGGGWGEPTERPAAAVAADVGDGCVSAAAARRSYGVVLDADGQVNAAATRRQRQRLRALRRHWPLAPRPPLAGACLVCGQELPADAPLPTVALAPRHIFPMAPTDSRFTLHLSACPQCGALLAGHWTVRPTAATTRAE